MSDHEEYLDLLKSFAKEIMQSYKGEGHPISSKG